MSLTEIISFDKDGNPEPEGSPRLIFRRLFLALVIILVATLSFGVGRLTAPATQEGIRVEYDEKLTTNNQQPTTNSPKNQTANVLSSTKTNSLEVVGSVNSNKYHYLHCPGAKQISEKNKISFASPQAAEASGYTLAANCTPR